MLLSFVLVECHGHKIVMQVVGGDPLLKLIAVDWFTVDNTADRIALHPRCLVQVSSNFQDFISSVFKYIVVKYTWGKDARFSLDIFRNDFANASTNSSFEVLLFLLLHKLDLLEIK